MSKKGSSLLAWDSLLASESNSEIKKLMKRKMKAGVSAARFRTALNKWRSAQTQMAKKILKRELRAL